MFDVLGNVTFCGPQGPQNVIHPQNVKQCYVLRDPHLLFGSYAVKIIITFCVKLLRFGLSSYVLGNVTFCGPTRPTITTTMRVRVTTNGPSLNAEIDTGTQ